MLPWKKKLQKAFNRLLVEKETIQYSYFEINNLVFRKERKSISDNKERGNDSLPPHEPGERRK